MSVHQRRVLGVVEVRDLRRPRQQAAVVADHPQALQRPRDARRRSSPGRCRGRGSPAGAGPASGRRSRAPTTSATWRADLGVVGDLVVGRLQAAVAGGAADGHRLAAGRRQVLGRQRQGQQRVGLVGRASSRSRSSRESPAAPGPAPWPPPASRGGSRGPCLQASSRDRRRSSRLLASRLAGALGTCRLRSPPPRDARRQERRACPSRASWGTCPRRPRSRRVRSLKAAIRPISYMRPRRRTMRRKMSLKTGTVVLGDDLAARRATSAAGRRSSPRCPPSAGSA